MKNKIFLLVLGILLISSISALDFSIQFNDKDISNAVIFNTYKLYLNGELSGNLTSDYTDQLTLLNDYGTSRIYEWTTNSKAGERNFEINGETFTFPVISEVNEMLNQITNFKIFIGENNSYIETNFDLDNTTQEMQFIEYQGYSANINFANLLRGLNAKIELRQGETYPLVDYLKINSSTAITVVEALFMEEGHSFTVDDFNSDPQYYLNYLIDYYNLQHEYEETSIIEKNNNYYKIQTNYGYSSVSGDLENQVQEFIESKLEYFTPLDIIDELFKFTDYNLSEYVDLDYDYSVVIDFNNLVLEDGIYTLTFLYTDSHNNTGTKDFNVNLDIEEIIPEPEPEPDSPSGSSSNSGGGSYRGQTEPIEQIEPAKPNVISGGVPIEVINDIPEPEQSKTIYILLGMLILSIILIILIICLILKERKNKDEPKTNSNFTNSNLIT